MADNATGSAGTVAPAAPAPAPASTSTGSSQAAPAPSSFNPVEVEKAFGIEPVSPYVPQPSPQQNAAAEGPDASGQPSKGSSEPTPDNGQGAANGQTPAGEEDPLASDLAGLAGLEPAKPQDGQPQGGTEQNKTPDDATKQPIGDIDKAINPDGRQTSEQQVANARKLLKDQEVMIGRQSAEVGELRKTAKELQQAFHDMTNSGLIEFGSDGKARTINVIKAAEMAGDEEVARQLESRGLKLVPIDQQAGQASGGQQSDIESILNEIVPDKEITTQEKYQMVLGDAQKFQKFNDRIVTTKFDRERKAAEKAVTEQRDRTRIQMEVAAEVDRIQKELPHFKQIEPRMMAWNQIIGTGPLQGKTRVDVLRRLSESERMPTAIRAAYEKGLKIGQQNAAKLNNMVLGDPSPAANASVNASGAPNAEQARSILG